MASQPQTEQQREVASAPRRYKSARVHGLLTVVLPCVLYVVGWAASYSHPPALTVWLAVHFATGFVVGRWFALLLPGLWALRHFASGFSWADHYVSEHVLQGVAAVAVGLGLRQLLRLWRHINADITSSSR
jgi:hypothetical protein